jgi:hypothetical protein
MLLGTSVPAVDDNSRAVLPGAEARLTDGTNREEELAGALALLDRQPRTEQSLRDAERRLAVLWRAGLGDDTGRMAAYLWARYAHVHAIEPDLREAARRYRWMIEGLWPHPVAELAVVKLAMIDLGQRDARRLGAADYAPFERWLAGMQSRELAAELHLVIGRTAARHGSDPERAFQHLAAALRTEQVRHTATRAEVLVMLLHFAEQLGRVSEGVVQARRFLEEFPRDPRAHEVRRRLSELKRREEAEG